MREKINYIKEKRWIHYLFIVIVGILVSIPFLWVQIRTTDDGYVHLIRTMWFDIALEKGEFPFLVFPYLCRNFGYTMTAFYPPIVTYFPYICSLISSSFVNGLKIFSTLTMVLSGITMYNFINEVTKKKSISLISAIVYMILPYRFENLFNRFALGEFTCFIFIPIAFQGLYNLLNGDKKRHFYIAIGAIGILLSHTISTVYTALFCMFYIIFNLNKFFKKDVIIKCIINVIFILLITAFFIVPMFEFKMAAEYTIFNPGAMRTYGGYTQSNTIELWQLLKDKVQENPVSFVVGVPAIFMLAITILVYGKIDKKYKDFYIIYWALGFIAIFMCLKYFPWRLMPNFLNVIQYPWRLMGFGVFFLSPICSINIYYLVHSFKKEWIKNALYILFFCILAIFTALRLSTYYTEDTDIDKNYEAKLKENKILSHFHVNRDYLPYKSLVLQSGYVNEREDRIYVLEGQATVSNQKKDGLDFKCNIDFVKKDSVLELPYFFYPGYKVVLQDGEEEILLETFESDSGFLSIKIPHDLEDGILTINYIGTTLEKVSYAISAISVVGFVIYIISFKKKVKIGESDER